MGWREGGYGVGRRVMGWGEEDYGMGGKGLWGAQRDGGTDGEAAKSVGWAEKDADGQRNRQRDGQRDTRSIMGSAGRRYLPTPAALPLWAAQGGCRSAGRTAPAVSARSW